MNPPLFDPWVGPDYGKTSLGRLLLLGESHYFYHTEPDYASFTKRMIEGLGTTEDNNFYIKVGQIFDPADYRTVWPKIAFGNAIQFPFRVARQAVTREHLNTVEPAVRAYLELTKPTRMIVFSSRVWHRGLSQTWGRPIKTLQDGTFGRRATVWEFDYPVGSCHGIGVHHPSSSRPPFLPEEWRPIINQFLEERV